MFPGEACEPAKRRGVIKASERAGPPRCQPPSFQRVTPAGVERCAYLCNVWCRGPYHLAGALGLLNPPELSGSFMLEELVLMCSPKIIFHSLDICQLTALCRWNAEIIQGSSGWFFMEVLSASFPGEAERVPWSSLCLVWVTCAVAGPTTVRAPLDVFLHKCQPQCDNW